MSALFLVNMPWLPAIALQMLGYSWFNLHDPINVLNFEDLKYQWPMTIISFSHTTTGTLALVLIIIILLVFFYII